MNNYTISKRVKRKHTTHKYICVFPFFEGFIVCIIRTLSIIPCQIYIFNADNRHKKRICTKLRSL